MIDDIKQAIQNLSKLRVQIDAEYSTVMETLRKARFVSIPQRNLIDKQYQDKMNGYDQQISDMQENLKRLEGSTND